MLIHIVGAPQRGFVAWFAGLGLDGGSDLRSGSGKSVRDLVWLSLSVTVVPSGHLTVGEAKRTGLLF